jgi:hypothetical protein
MRKDMSKVIVERPRLGRAAAGLKPGRTRALVDDDGEPIKAKGAREPKAPLRKTKALNENLNPLRRYLESNVDRPWNKVFSEISEHLKATSTVQQHVRDHLEDFVAVKTRMRKGEVVVINRYGGEAPLSAGYFRLYVHPRTGLLRKNQYHKSWSARHREKRKREEQERAKRMRVINDKTQAHLFDGVWWEVKLAKWTPERPCVDVVHDAGLSTTPLEQLYGRSGVYARARRAYSKAEKKELALV